MGNKVQIWVRVFWVTKYGVTQRLGLVAVGHTEAKHYRVVVLWVSKGLKFWGLRVVQG